MLSERRSHCQRVTTVSIITDPVDLRLAPGKANYAVFGHPAAHSKSPRIHHAFATQTGIELYYQAIDVPLDGFEIYLRAFRTQGGKGINITVPFKQQAFALCTRLLPRAQVAGAVNTIWLNDAIHGDNTDGAGLLSDLRYHGIDIRGKRVLILGAGGAVRGVIGPLIEQRPGQILVANRTLATAKGLVSNYPGCPVLGVCDLNTLQSEQDFDLAINAIPAGLTAELPVLPDGLVKPGGCCYDMVYGTSDTAFVSWGKHHGVRTVLDGLGMLVEQAAESFYLWHGVRPETRTVVELVRKGA